MGSAQWKTTYFAVACGFASASTSASCTPFHLPIALQPSTQSWRVICVRAGIARSCASVSLIGFSTRPSTCRDQSAKWVAASAWYSGLFGLAVPLLRKVGERSFSKNSGAMALRDVTGCCGALVSFSVEPSILGNHSLLDSRSQPARKSVPVAPVMRSRKLRRSFRVGMRSLQGDAIPARDHRSQVVPEPGDDHFEYVDQDEADQEPCGDEVKRARRLPAAEEIHPARHDRVRPWRHRNAHQDQERQHDEDDREVGELLQDVVFLRRLDLRMAEAHVVP